MNFTNRRPILFAMIAFQIPWVLATMTLWAEFNSTSLTKTIQNLVDLSVLDRVEMLLIFLGGEMMFLLVFSRANQLWRSRKKEDRALVGVNGELAITNVTMSPSGKAVRVSVAYILPNNVNDDNSELSLSIGPYERIVPILIPAMLSGRFENSIDVELPIPEEERGNRLKIVAKLIMNDEVVGESSFEF